MPTGRAREIGPPDPARPRRSTTAAAVTACALLGLGLAACGGGATPTVAHLGSTTTTTSAVAPGGSSGGASLAQATKFSACMRSHGVANYPDPTPMPGGQGFGFKVNGVLNASKSQVHAAEKACGHLLPNQGVGQALTAAQQQAFLDWAACIRAQGLPGFSDPDFSGGGVHFQVTPGMGSPDKPSPQFQAAQRACKSKLPAGFGAIGG